MVGIHEVCGPYLRLSEFYQQNLVCDKIIIAYSSSKSKPRLEFAIIEINCLVSKSKYEIICFGNFPTNIGGKVIYGQRKVKLFDQYRSSSHVKKEIYYYIDISSLDAKVNHYYNTVKKV